MTEVTEVGAGAQTTGSASSDTPQFVKIKTDDDLSSKVIGLDVYNNSKQDIGTVKDIAYDSNRRVEAYVLSVGGFLGLGEHYVSVAPSALSVGYNTSNQKWTATMNATADQLKAAPEFKYTGRWNAGKS